MICEGVLETRSDTRIVAKGEGRIVAQRGRADRGTWNAAIWCPNLI